MRVFAGTKLVEEGDGGCVVVRDKFSRITGNDTLGRCDIFAILLIRNAGGHRCECYVRFFATCHNLIYECKFLIFAFIRFAAYAHVFFILTSNDISCIISLYCKQALVLSGEKIGIGMEPNPAMSEEEKNFQLKKSLRESSLKMQAMEERAKMLNKAMIELKTKISLEMVQYYQSNPSPPSNK